MTADAPPTRRPEAATRAPRAARPPSDYAQLLAIIQSAGLLGRRYSYYAVRLALLLLALGGVGVAFTVVGDSWWQLLVATGAAIVLTQIIFFSHDAAHRQIFTSHRANENTARIMGTLIGGVSLSWWNNKHNRHHAAPNQIGRDSDIDPSIVHFFPADTPPRSRIGLWLHQRQGIWFFPLLIVEMLNLHVQGVQALLTQPGLRRRRTELVMLGVRLGGYPAALFWLLSPGRAVAFLAVQLAVTGLYLGGAFSASHIGMPVLPRDARVDFFRRQVETSRNVLGGAAASFAMGGLNYQIEHHLFPNMARPNLHRARPLIQQFCREHHVTYHEVNILQAWGIVVTYLNRVGLTARAFQCPITATLR